MMVIPHPSCKETQAEATSSLSLDYCLQLFTRNEKLNQQNMWYCPHCKEHKQAFKKLDVWRLPKVLVVHLKRFVYEGAWREKICTNVDFPQEWDLTPHARHSDQAVYSLYAVSSHSGGLGGGHYTAYCRHSETSRWYLFNDSSTSPVAAHDVRDADTTADKIGAAMREMIPVLGNTIHITVTIDDDYDKNLHPTATTVPTIILIRSK
ncbi:Calcium and calcium/calmodulin-dependent serine/threonine-protein kinase [Pelomyxa schiedti]|nr:Calcium and calcium/calmodulin-dependent serine/threonine-protein kinase [Pelomyxa schiedti]